MSQEVVNAVELAVLQEKTYSECGIAEIQPLGRKVFVRTLPPPAMTQSGLLFVPNKQTEFFSGPMHRRMVTARVLAVGPQTCHGVKPGDTVMFVRQYFAYYKKLEDGTLFGWVDETDISGHVDDGARVEMFDDTPPPRTR